MKLDIVLTHGDENFSWIYDLQLLIDKNTNHKIRLFVYDNEFESHSVRELCKQFDFIHWHLKEIKNINGIQSHFRYIVSNYNNLPDYSLFLHGHK